MKKFISKISILFLSSLLFLSCEDHLDVGTFNNITGASYWKTPEDAKTYVVGIAADYRSILNGSIGYFTISEGRTDMLKPGTGGPTLTGHPESHTQTALSGGGNWRNWYNTIHHCNLLIQQTAELEFEDENEKNDIIAQGHVYRALVYFDLVRIFGDVPIVTEPTTGRPNVEDYLGRSDKNEVFALIRSDIETALSLFSSNNINDKNYVSRIAALALKAEVNMWTAKALNARGSSNASELDAAINAIDQVLNSGAVTFETNYADIFSRQANSSSEYIFANYYAKDELNDNVFRRATIRPGFLPDPALEGTFPHALVSEGHSNISYGDFIDTLYDPTDLRYIHNVFNIPGTADQVITKFGGYIEQSENRRYWDNDIPLFRYSDLLLLKAEALNTLGRTGEAIVILNMTRNRAGIGDYSGGADQDSVEDEILNERARELAFENKRWWDLCRAHKVAEFVPRFMTSRGDDSANQNVWDFYYWPLAESVLLSNPTLTQTQGY